MCADDLLPHLDLALSAAGLDHVTVVHKPRLLSDNGSSYVAGDLAKWLEAKGMEHVRGAPYHPQTQRKIERWHQALRQSSPNDNASSVQPSQTDACSISCRPPKL
jgi:putative transposase